MAPVLPGERGAVIGKSSKPTRIVIASSCADWPEIIAKKTQGHEIIVMESWLEAVDLILSPNAWNMDESLRPYLLSHTFPAAVKAADARKKNDGDDPGSDWLKV